MTLKARVKGGRLVVDEPTDCLRGRRWSFFRSTPGTGSTTPDRVRLHDALLESEGDVEAGRLVSAEDVLRELRQP